jgi:hypothetical protein
MVGISKTSIQDVTKRSQLSPSLKVKDRNCILGYTNTYWLSPYADYYFGDNDGMFFILSSCQYFPSKQKG